MKNEVFLENESIKKLNKLIQKSRLHFYKPIQIAEILFHHRTEKSINLNSLESYRNISKKWRDNVTSKLVGSISTSSQKFQDNIFDKNAISPHTLNELGKINEESGEVEKYIYRLISLKFENLEKIVNLCKDKKNFDLKKLIDTARNDNDLKRSIDKVYEVIVYSLMSELLKDLELNIKLEISSKKIDEKYMKYNQSFLNFDTKKKTTSKVFRAGVANAADGGIDLWSNFGWVIQVKHLNLDKETFKKIIKRQDCEKIIIVCREIDFDYKNELKKLNNDKVSILNESDLIDIYKVVMQDNQLIDDFLHKIIKNLNEEFPMIGNKNLIDKFFLSRGYIT